jgi:hypothetical protein
MGVRHAPREAAGDNPSRSECLRVLWLQRLPIGLGGSMMQFYASRFDHYPIAFDDEKVIPQCFRFLRRVPVGRQTYHPRTRKKLCLVCLADLPSRRSSYCSDECWYRNTPRPMRHIVNVRDGEQCALCRGYNRGCWDWEMDHTVPMSEGGGLCGPEGYRTLCPRHHKKETRSLRSRLRQVVFA